MRQAVGVRVVDDVRYAVRSLARSPGYTAVAIVTLALGIASTTAAFTVIGSVLLKPLPFADPDQLVSVLSTTRGNVQSLPSYPDFEDIHGQQDVFSGLAFITGDGVIYHRPQGSEAMLAAMVTDDFFPLLRARPALGRLLTPTDNQPGAAPVAILSYAMWVRDFAMDHAVIGKTIGLNVGEFTIVGVLDTGQAYPEWVPGMHANLYVPLASVPYIMKGAVKSRDSHSDSRTIARLRTGVTRAQAEQRLRTITARLAAAYPESDSGLSITLRPLREQVVGDIAPAFAVLGVAVTLVLLLACADVANLALVRATGRTREIAVRTALGAGRAVVVRGLLTESALLAAGGGVLGVFLAIVAVRAFIGASPSDIPRLDEVGVDIRALGAAVAATSAAAILCTLAPIAVTSRGDLVSILNAGGRGSSAGRRGLRLRSAIVTVQVALSVVLIVGAGLLIKSFAILRRVDPGYDPRHLITWGFRVPAGRFDDAPSRLALLRRIDAAMNVPGVQSVAFAAQLPLDPGGRFTPVGPDGRDTSADSVGASYSVVGPGYFATMRQPILKGREFTEGDMLAGVMPSIVSATAARRYWPNGDPIGHEMTVINSIHGQNPDFGKPIRTTVVGVAGDVKKFTLDEEPYPEVYVPITHGAPVASRAIARTTSPPEALLATIRRAVAQIDPDIPVTDLTIDESRIAGGLARQRFIMSLLSVVSVVALGLAALGLYGVIAYSVTQRVSEFGIRMALGAKAGDIVHLVVRGTATLLAVGLLLGGGGALMLGRAMRSLLYGVTPADPMVLLTVAALLSLVAVLASYLPARRAARVDPAGALRVE